MNNVDMFIELLKLESKKAAAVAEQAKGGPGSDNKFAELQKLRSAAFTECVEWAELILKTSSK